MSLLMDGMNLTDNSSVDDLYLDIGQDFFASTQSPRTLVLIGVYVPVFLFAIFGNIFVLLVILLNSRMRSSAANYFLVNLAVADILVAVCCIPMTVTEIVYQVWIFGDVMCKLTGYLQGIYIGASVLTFVCMSIDRFFAIRYPMTNRQIFTVGKVKILIGITWLLAAVVMLPLPIIRELEVHTLEDISGFSLRYCSEKWSRYTDRQIYDVFLLFFIYIIPGFLIMCLYALMGCKLWRRDIRLQRQNSSINNEAKMMLSRRRLALMMIVIAILFAVCWLPYYIISIIMDFDGSMSKDLISLYPFALLLGHTNSAQNPILYCFMHRGFKTCLVRILKCQCSKIRYERQMSISRGYSERNATMSPRTPRNTESERSKIIYR